MYSLEKLSKILNGYVIGNKNTKVFKFSTLESAEKGHISFFSNKKYLKDLKNTKASAILTSKEFSNLSQKDSIILNNPYFALTKISKIFSLEPKPTNKIHSTSIINKSAKIKKNASIGCNVVIGKNVLIGKNVIIGDNTVISDYCTIGDYTEIKYNVSIHYNVIIGKKCIIHSNSVIGSDGFGNAKNINGQWVKIPQIGKVLIEDNVEIGSCSTIDRGSISDTIIKEGVRIDNQVQIAHNVCVGKNTAIASGTGIAGSSKIGNNCLIGGKSGIVGHISICNDTILAAASNVSKTIKNPGMYTAGFNAKPHMIWKRAHARFFRIKKIEEKIKKIFKKLKI